MRQKQYPATIAMSMTRSEMQVALSGQDLLCTLLDFERWIHGQVKHGDAGARMDALAEAQMQLHEALSAHSVDIYTLGE